MITAKEFRLSKLIDSSHIWSEEEILIEFVKLHVIEALKQASEKVKMTGIAYGDDKSISDYEVDRNSILTAYDLNLIK